MTTARATYVWSHRQPGECDIRRYLTDEEYQEVVDLWRTMPGNCNLMDAFFTVLNGGVRFLVMSQDPAYWDRGQLRWRAPSHQVVNRETGAVAGSYDTKHEAYKAAQVLNRIVPPDLPDPLGIGAISFPSPTPTMMRHINLTNVITV